ncbi:MAG: hypothetical protein IPH13_10905 [Planctomycetes bacterium]|nr:hypothetical protein [Planctomycetota bacterium]MCC7169004.1 hypothetical protein [Planctomycetota bacterium]
MSATADIGLVVCRYLPMLCGGGMLRRTTRWALFGGTTIDSTDSADPAAPHLSEDERVPLHRARSRAWSLLNFVNAMCLISFDYVAPAPFDFDVMPDELGFALFAFAAWRLRTEATAFSIAQWSAIVGLLGLIAARFLPGVSGAGSRAIDLVVFGGETVAVSIAAIGCARLASRYDAAAITLFAHRAGFALLGLTLCIYVVIPSVVIPSVAFAIAYGRLGAYVACGIAFARLGERVERDVRALRRPRAVTQQSS